MELAPHERMAIAMHTNPGAYALLLGSGVSRSAGVPTGWDIVLTLIRRIAALRGVESLDDPEEWYVKELGVGPTFGDILDKLRLTREERRRVLVPFIEGDNTDCDEPASPRPTPAHRAIASLVCKGYVRLILTTNIDRLLETALEDASAAFDLVTSEADYSGMRPLHELDCLVAKLHGDYKEEGVRLATAELKEYPESIRSFLRTVLPQFGLLVCGWSSKWDTALQDVLLGSPCRRYSSFWLSLVPTPSEPARKVISALKATLVSIEGADETLPRLHDNVGALEESTRPHPISVQLAVDSVRKYANQNGAFGRLESLLHTETERLYDALLEEGERWEGKRMRITKAFQERLRRCEGLVERMVAVASTVAFYCGAEGPWLLSRCIERIGSLPEQHTPDSLSELQRYSALLLVYATGIAALASERYDNVHAALMISELWDNTARCWTRSLALLNSTKVFDDEDWENLPMGNVARPWLRPSIYISDHVLQPLLQRYARDDREHQRLFDVFEFIQSLAHFDTFKPSCPLLGRFTTCSDYFVKGDLPREFSSAIGRFYERHLRGKRGQELLEADFFDCDSKRMQAALHAHRVAIADINEKPRSEPV